jgi:hypothetical protein
MSLIERFIHCNVYIFCIFQMENIKLIKDPEIYYKVTD